MINTVEDLEKIYGKKITELSKKDWEYISMNLGLSEEFIRAFKNQVVWVYMPLFQKLSEEFICEFQREIDWAYVSSHQKLSEQFIRDFENQVYWPNISRYQKLSEKFMREFENKNKFNFCWHNISRYQKLSKEFICDFASKVIWEYISAYQNLSEDFIREFKDRVNWEKISAHQNLSEDFIREFEYRVSWGKISAHQKLSPAFMHYFSSKIFPYAARNNWRIKPISEKKELIRKYYEIINIDGIEYAICYKAVCDDYSSIYSPFTHTYNDLLKIYETKCDYYSNNEHSYGFNCCTRRRAIQFGKETKKHNYRLITVICPLEYICIVENDYRDLRAEKMRIISL